MNVKKHFCELFWLKLLFYIFSKCSDSLVLRKKTHQQQQKQKQNKRPNRLYVQTYGLCIGEENSSVSFITFLFAFSDTYNFLTLRR